MIYVFTNEGYGGPFIAAIRTFAARDHRPVTIVFSSQKLGRRRPRLRSLAILRWVVLAIPTLLPLLLDRRVSVSLVRDVNDQGFVDRVADGDVGLVCGFNQIFKAETIRRFRRLVNVHPSLLPLYRGPIPSYWCLLNRETATGFTIHDVTAEIDAGPVLAQGVVAIQSTDTPASLDLRIAKAASQGLDGLLHHLISGAPFPVAKVDAYTVYRSHVAYASWPNAQAGVG